MLIRVNKIPINIIAAIAAAFITGSVDLTLLWFAVWEL